MDRESPDVGGDSAVFALFARHCPILMREAVICIEENRKNENLIAFFGFSVPVKWLTLVYLYCRRIEKIAAKMAAAGGSDFVPYLSQVKSKFGSLRIYLRYPDAIEAAEFREYQERIEAILQHAAMRYQDSE